MDCDDAECVIALEVPRGESSEIFEEVRSLGTRGSSLEIYYDYSRITLMVPFDEADDAYNKAWNEVNRIVYGTVAAYAEACAVARRLVFSAVQR